MTHYEVLGIPRDATPEEIRRAWAQKLREHPPDRDPVGNQRINEAKRTLLDPKARRRYDAQLDHGPEVEALLVKATEAANREDHAAAAAELKKAVALAPDNDEIRNIWALETKRAGDVDGAVKILRDLVDRVPDVALYQFNLGTMLMEQAGAWDKTRLSEALEWIRKAIALEPSNADYHVGLAQCYTQMGRYRDAENAIEEAVRSDGVVDVQDLEALFYLPVIHAVAGQPHRVRADTERIRRVAASAGPEALAFCGLRFAITAAALWELGHQYAARRLADAAVACDPTNTELAEALKPIRSEGRFKLTCGNACLLAIMFWLGLSIFRAVFDALLRACGCVIALMLAAVLLVWIALL